MRSAGPVLVGHDGSEEAGRALSWAADLAAITGGGLVAAHVYSVGDYAGGPDTAAAGGEELLEQWMAGADLHGLPAERIERVVASGRPGPMLVQAADASGAELVVLGAHDRPLAGSALGRVAQHVTFRAPCPVAVVRYSGGALSSAPIVVGFDVEHCNLEVVSWAESLAARLKVDVEAVTVVPEHVTSPPMDHLADILARNEGPRVGIARLTGDPGPELMTRAYRLDASAIVIGQRRKHNLGGRLLGHTASWLLRKSDRPVIVLNHD